MTVIRKKGILWYFFRAPVYLYRWRSGWLFGYRLLLWIDIGHRTGLRRQTVLEVVEHRKEIPEAVVVNGFGPDSDCVATLRQHPARR